LIWGPCDATQHFELRPEFLNVTPANHVLTVGGLHENNIRKVVFEVKDCESGVYARMDTRAKRK
jgi:hypothetical protein